jgi:hypothetical protein
MATASPSPTPNPDAMKFDLDVTLPETISFSTADEAAGNAFAAAVLGAGGVANVFGVNNFVTITREPGVDWDELVPRVVEAARDHL